MLLDRFCRKAAGGAMTPLASKIPDLYVTLRNYDADWSNFTGLTPDIVMPAIGRRFIPCEVRDGEDFKFANYHHDTYAFGFETIPYHSFSHLWGPDPHNADTTMFRVQLKYADDIFVADEQRFLDKRKATKEQRSREKRRVTQSDDTATYAALAQTYIPLQDYQGDYVRPIYLIGRDLKAEEAQKFVPEFKKRIWQAELERMARVDTDHSLIDDMIQSLNPQPAQKSAAKPSHLRLVVDN